MKKTLIICLLAFTANFAFAAGIEVAGIVNAKNVFTYVTDGETDFAEAYVKDGDEVKKGDKLIRVVDNKAAQQFLNYLEKKENLTDKINGFAVKSDKLEYVQQKISDLQGKISEGEKVLNNFKNTSTYSDLRDKLTELQLQEKELVLALADYKKNKVKYEKALEIVNSNIKDTENSLENEVVKAPFDGKIAYVASPFNSAGSKALELWSNDVQVEADVWQQHIGSVKVGDIVRIVPNFSNNKELKGEVLSIGVPKSAENGETFVKFPVTIGLSSSADVKAGFSVTVYIGE